METLLIISILGWSVTNILVNGSIFDSLRIYLQVINPTLSKLLTCIQCSGFWVGILAGFLISAKQLSNPFESILINDSLLNEALMIVFLGFWISGISVILNSFLIFLINPSHRKINTDGEM